MATKAVLVRFNEQELEAFLRRFPWHGSLSQFLNQCVAEFNSQYVDVPTPSDIAKRSVTNVIKQHY